MISRSTRGNKPSNRSASLLLEKPRRPTETTDNKSHLGLDVASVVSSPLACGSTVAFKRIASFQDSDYIHALCTQRGFQTLPQITLTPSPPPSSFPNYPPDQPELYSTLSAPTIQLNPPPLPSSAAAVSQNDAIFNFLPARFRRSSAVF